MNGVDTVVQILAETSLPNQLLQVHIRSTDEPDIHRNGLGAAHPYHTPVLDHTQQLRLQVQRNIADLIKEQCPAIGLFELAHMVRVGIGEGALHMTEEFTFKQRLSDGASINGHHRLLTPEAVGVDLPCQHILTGAVLTGDEHCSICRGDLIKGLADVGHGPGRAPEHISIALLRMTAA